MSSAKELASLFGSLSFLVVGVGGYFTTANPLQSLFLGITATVVMAFIGYRIGFIVTHPRGRRKSKSKVETEAGHPGGLTGEESLLDEPPPVRALEAPPNE